MGCAVMNVCVSGGFVIVVLFACLLSKERKRKGMEQGGWGGSRDLAVMRNHDQSILYEKIFSIKNMVFLSAMHILELERHRA